LNVLVNVDNVQSCSIQFKLRGFDDDYSSRIAELMNNSMNLMLKMIRND
jgi:hypothetical protein